VGKGLKAKSMQHAVRDGNMQVLSVVLVLISIGCIVGPIGDVVLMYRNNLPGLVIPPQINNLMNGNKNNNQGNDNNNNINNYNNSNYNNSDNNNNNNGNNGFITPTFVSSQINNAAKTFTVTVNVTNSFGYDLTLNSMNATVESSTDNYQLGTITLTSPVTIIAGQIALVTVSGMWTQDAVNYVQNNFSGATSINVNLADISIDVNGIVVQQTQPVNVGNVPLT